MSAASGGTRRAVTSKALAARHEVTAFARHADRIAPARGLTVVDGDAVIAADVAPAQAGKGAVAISFGNSRNATAVPFGTRRTTLRNVCGTARAIFCRHFPRARGSSSSALPAPALCAGRSRSSVGLQPKLRGVS